jgi:hypothetical protein
MTKRQWFLVAGTLVLAACSGIADPNWVCEQNDDTGETVCESRLPLTPAETPSPSVGGTDESGTDN